MTTKFNHKSGVAIISVLGLIAILMIMGVAFSIQMRIERAGAASYSHSTQSRHMVWAGLANAIEDIDSYLTTNGTFKIYPDSDLWGSQGAIKAPLMSKTASEYILPQMLNSIRLNPPYWKAIHISNTNSMSIGRYAYEVINLSGLIDINRLGQQPRRYGTNLNELAYFPGISNPNTFLALTNQVKRFESFKEIVALNGANIDQTNVLYSTYSMAPCDTFVDGSTLTKKVYIGPDMTQWNASDIQDALMKSGIKKYQLVYSNLLDFVDADNIPQNLASGCTESVPMINEVGVWYQANHSGNSVNGNIAVYVEYWYPFVTPSTEGYNMNINVSITPKSGNDFPGLLPSVLNGITTRSISPGLTLGAMSPLGASETVSISTTNALVDIHFTMEIKVTVDGGGGTVDASPWPAGNTGFKFDIDIAGLADGATSNVVDLAECIDPRFNWDPTSMAQWIPYKTLKMISPYTSTAVPELVPYGPSPMPDNLPYKTNLVTIMYNNPSAYGQPEVFDVDRDSYIKMYVANRPLKTVGELGFLCYDIWRTVRLYDHGFANFSSAFDGSRYHDVLDRFTVDNKSTKRGVINVNSKERDVIAAAFYNVPENEYISNSSQWVLNDQYYAIADAIITNGPYTNISEIGTSNINWKAFAKGNSEIDRESLIRNTAGLLTTRYNLFAIIMRADSFVQKMGSTNDVDGSSLSSTRAVAEVWRDPVPDEHGINKSFIRYFRYIDD